MCSKTHVASLLWLHHPLGGMRGWLELTAATSTFQPTGKRKERQSSADLYTEAEAQKGTQRFHLVAWPELSHVVQQAARGAGKCSLSLAGPIPR